MKIHENFHVKGIFHHDKSDRMKVYTCIYLVCFSGLHLLHIYPSVDFLSKYLTRSPEEIIFMDIEKPFTFFMVKKGIKSNHNNLLSFNY